MKAYRPLYTPVPPPNSSIEAGPPPPPPPSYTSAPPPPPDLFQPPPPPDTIAPPPPPPEGDQRLPEPREASPISVGKKKKTGWGSQPKTVPLSVEELLRKKREADEAASKVCPNALICRLTHRDVYATLCRIPASNPSDSIGAM